MHYAHTETRTGTPMQVPDEMTTSLSFQTDVSTVRRNWYSRIGSLRLFNFQNVFWNGVPKKLLPKAQLSDLQNEITT